MASPISCSQRASVAGALLPPGSREHAQPALAPRPGRAGQRGEKPAPSARRERRSHWGRGGRWKRTCQSQANGTVQLRRWHDNPWQRCPLPGPRPTAQRPGEQGLRANVGLVAAGEEGRWARARQTHGGGGHSCHMAGSHETCPGLAGCPPGPAPWHGAGADRLQGHAVPWDPLAPAGPGPAGTPL